MHFTTLCFRFALHCVWCVRARMQFFFSLIYFALNYFCYRYMLVCFICFWAAISVCLSLFLALSLCVCVYTYILRSFFQAYFNWCQGKVCYYVLYSRVLISIYMHVCVWVCRSKTHIALALVSSSIFRICSFFVSCRFVTVCECVFFSLSACFH